MSHPEDTEPGRRECIGHSVFHIEISERRTCKHCNVSDHRGRHSDDNYLNFVHRVNVERIVQQHGMMSVEQINAKRNSNSNGNGEGEGGGYGVQQMSSIGQRSSNKHNVSLDQVLRRIIDVHWLRACPEKPLCELCMGRVATTTCKTCDSKSVR